MGLIRRSDSAYQVCSNVYEYMDTWYLGYLVLLRVFIW